MTVAPTVAMATAIAVAMAAVIVVVVAVAVTRTTRVPAHVGPGRSVFQRVRFLVGDQAGAAEVIRNVRHRAHELAVVAGVVQNIVHQVLQRAAGSVHHVLHSWIVDGVIWKSCRPVAMIG